MDIVEKYIPNCMDRKILRIAKEKYNSLLNDERKKFRNKKYKYTT